MEKSRYKTSFADGYPPMDHFMRDLQITLDFPVQGLSTIRCPVVPEVCTDRGTLPAGVMAIMVDILGGGLSVRNVYPDWIATSHMTLVTRTRIRTGWAVASGSVMRAGSQSVTIEMTIAQKDLEGKSETVGSALMSFSRLPRRRDNPDLEIKRETDEGYRFVGASPERTGSFPERVGIDVLDEANGVVELRMTPYVRNSFGALQGGMVAFLGDVAGQIAARKAAGREFLTNDLTVTYLAQGRRGPFRTSAKVLRMTRDTVLTQIHILDKGAQGRLITVVINTATLG